MDTGPAKLPAKRRLAAWLARQSEPAIRPVFRWVAGVLCLFFLFSALVTAFPSFLGSDQDADFVSASTSVFIAFLCGELAATGSFAPSRAVRRDGIAPAAESEPKESPLSRWLAGLFCVVVLFWAVTDVFPGLTGSDDEPNFVSASFMAFVAFFLGFIAATGSTRGFSSELSHGTLADGEPGANARPVFRSLAGVLCLTVLFVSVTSAFPGLVGWNQEPNYEGALVVAVVAILFGAAAATGSLDFGRRK